MALHPHFTGEGTAVWRYRSPGGLEQDRPKRLAASLNHPDTGGGGGVGSVHGLEAPPLGGAAGLQLGRSVRGRGPWALGLGSPMPLNFTPMPQM